MCQRHVYGDESPDLAAQLRCSYGSTLSLLHSSCLVLLHAFGCADDFAISVLVDANGDKDGYVFKLTTLTALEV